MRFGSGICLFRNAIKIFANPAAALPGNSISFINEHDQNRHQSIYATILHMNELIFVVDEAPEGGDVARALGEGIFTEADDLDSLHRQVREGGAWHFVEGRAPHTDRLGL